MSREFNRRQAADAFRDEGWDFKHNRGWICPVCYKKTQVIIEAKD